MKVAPPAERKPASVAPSSPTAKLDAKPAKAAEQAASGTGKLASTGRLPAGRLVSLDAYRGFIMLMMASGGFGLPALAKHSDDPTLALVAGQLQHVPWRGGVFWDLIQPAFMFMVGVSMPFSYAVRQQRGATFGQMFRHALLRSIVLVLLGVLLASNHAQQTNWLFTNVLAQIGLGYALLFLAWRLGPAVQVIAAVAILGAYGWAFYQHPLPAEDQWPEFGVTAKDIEQGTMFSGEQAPWSKHINFAAEVDRKFLNLFPRKETYVTNEGGYTTLNFVPALATMIFGLLAGELLRSAQSARFKLVSLLVAGAVLLAGGLGLDMTVVPSVKRIWTPSWALVSGAWVVWMLAAFYAVIDMRGWWRWSMPLVVVGCNSIVMYLMAQLMRPWIVSTIKIHAGADVFSGTYGMVIQGTASLAVMWLICWWLYRQRLFVRI